MFGQAYRLIRATAAVVQGATRQVCKVLPEDSVIVLEGANDDGKKVNVRCGTEKLWMFARDLVERCGKLSRQEIESLPADLKLLAAPTSEDKNGFSVETMLEREAAANWAGSSAGALESSGGNSRSSGSRVGRHGMRCTPPFAHETNG